MTITCSKRQAGLSLVELLIAITLSLLLIAGVLQIFLSSKQTYSLNSALARVQESGRFAMEFLNYDIRNAGYKGQCLGAVNNRLNGGSGNADFNLDDPVTGWNNNKPASLNVQNFQAGTDVLRLKLAAGVGDFTADSNNSSSKATLDVDNLDIGGNRTGIKEGSIVLVADAQGCDLFQNANSNNSNKLQQAGKNVTPGNSDAPGQGGSSQYWSHDYTGDVEVLTLNNVYYYIQSNTGRPSSLARYVLKTNGANAAFVSEELVEGIQDMQITYGISGADRQVTSYVDASALTSNAQWENVRSIRIDLLAVSAQTNVVPENQVIAFNGSNVTIANRRLAQVFSTTVAIRNRLP